MAVCIGNARLRLVAASIGICVSVALPTAANAQVAIGASFGLSTQPPGANDRPYLGPGFGGTSIGSVILVDVDVSPTVTVGGELSNGGTIIGSQERRVSGGSHALLSKHRDTVVYGAVKVKPRTMMRYHIAVAGGFGLARRHTERSGTRTPGSRLFVTDPPDETLSDTVLAATGGVDGVFPIGRHVGILALARVHYLADKDRAPDGVVSRGVSSLIFRYGIGVRVRF